MKGKDYICGQCVFTNEKDLPKEVFYDGKIKF